MDFDPVAGSAIATLIMSDASTGSLNSFVRAPFSGGAGTITFTCLSAGSAAVVSPPGQTANIFLGLSHSNITSVAPGNALSLPGSSRPKPVSIDELFPTLEPRPGAADGEIPIIIPLEPFEADGGQIPIIIWDYAAAAQTSDRQSVDGPQTVPGYAAAALAAQQELENLSLEAQRLLRELDGDVTPQREDAIVGRLDAIGLRTAELISIPPPRPSDGQSSDVSDEEHDALQREFLSLLLARKHVGPERKQEIDRRLKEITDRIGFLLPAGRGGSTSKEASEELGDGEAILYAPREHSPALDVPWPLAYAEEPIAQFPSPIATTNTYTDINGMPVNIWTRVQGAFMDGTFDRSGISGSATVGVAAGFNARWDVGAYATVLGGHARAGAFNAEVDTVGGGVGLYTNYDFDFGGILGLSVLQIWAANDSNTGGVTGAFGSSFTRLDASLARPFVLDRLILTPAASLAYERLENDSFVDSSGTAIPSAIDERLVASGSVTASRPIFVGGEWIKRATPRLQMQGNYAAVQSSTPIAATGADLVTADDFTLDLTAGLDLALTPGGVVSLAGGVAGVAGDVQTYRGRASFKIPLN